MIRSDIFWTDSQQANERLAGSVILYDGEPHYVTGTDENQKGEARLVMTTCGTEQKTVRRLMNSSKFGRFRELPPIGWVNREGQAANFLRREARRTRTHGLADNNVQRFYLYKGNATQSDDRSITGLMNTEGFVNTVKGVFPSLRGVLDNIRDDTVIAYSRKYAVYREDGIKWLFRETDRIGLFTGSDTLNLLNKFSYYREEIMADPAFTLERIVEF